MKNIADTLRQVAEKRADNTGLIEAKTGKKLTFEQLEALSDQYAFYLKENGVASGDRVMLMVKPSADFICLTFALFKVGATIILIDPGMGYKNLLRCIDGVKPTVFVGIPKACIFKTIFRKNFRSIKKTFCCGMDFGLFGGDISKKVRKERKDKFQIYQPETKDLAAIIFTTGSTGPPKGVRYEHSIFSAQLCHIRDYYGISSEDIDQPAFPLFALFSTALGACAVIPDMDPTQPARVNPDIFIQSIKKYGVTYSFGSPAIWNVVSRHCLEKGTRLNSLKKVLMAGAPVPGELVERVFASISEAGHIFTPYGATESLPIVSMNGKEIVEETWPLTQKGKGTCVGRSLPGISIRVIKLSDEVIQHIGDTRTLEANTIGEIIVKGDVVTRGYENNVRETELSKIKDEDGFWHRMGDTGYLDDENRLWFCGRKAHRVETAKETKYTIPCEAIVNNHEAVFRSALVGVTDKTCSDKQEPVMIIEKVKDKDVSNSKLLGEIKELCKKSELTHDINHFLIHPSFPVDIRHNAKIFREKLAVWAEKEIHG